MLQKFLKEVIISVAGKPAEEIADLLNNKKHVNEFLIAKKLDITINQTRNILYKISDHGLVSSIRKKDKKKGWYTYFWKIEVLKSLEFLQKILIKRKEQVINQINSRETREFYFCKRCGIEFNQENALLNNFTCNECGDIFELKDNSKVLRELKKTLNRIENELKGVEEEMEKEKAKLEKEKQKELVKTKKEVAEARKVRAVASKKIRDAKKVADSRFPRDTQGGHKNLWRGDSLKKGASGAYPKGTRPKSLYVGRKKSIKKKTLKKKAVKKPLKKKRKK